MSEESMATITIHVSEGKPNWRINILVEGSGMAVNLAESIIETYEKEKKDLQRINYAHVIDGGDIKQ